MHNSEVAIGSLTWRTFCCIPCSQNYLIHVDQSDLLLCDMSSASLPQQLADVRRQIEGNSCQSTNNANLFSRKAKSLQHGLALSSFMFLKAARHR